VIYEITVAVVTFFAKLHRPGWHGNNYHRETSAHSPIGRSDGNDDEGTCVLSVPSKRERDEEGERRRGKDRGRKMKSEKERTSRIQWGVRKKRVLRLHYKSWESRKLITASEGCRKGPRETLKRAHLHPRRSGMSSTTK